MCSRWPQYFDCPGSADMSELYLHKRSSHVFPLTRIGEMPAITCGPVVFDAFLGLWSREKRLPHAAAMQRTNEIVALKEISTHTPLAFGRTNWDCLRSPGLCMPLGKKMFGRFETNCTTLEETPPVTASPGRSHQIGRAHV